MKCIVIADNFKKALSVIERAIGKDPAIPILSSYLISADKNTITITGTNLEIGIKISVRASISAPGQVVIPARQLSGYIATLQKDEKVTIESEGNDAKIITGTQETLFKGYPTEDYPPFPSIHALYGLTCKKNDIIDALARTTFSSSKTTVKPELSSIYFLFEREVLTVAATDSFRLSEEKIKPVGFSTKLSKTSFLLPTISAEESARFLEYSDDETAEISIGKGEAIITSSDAVLYSRLTEGTFPDYQQIIPQKFSTHLTVQRSQLVSHIRRASVFANKLSGITFSLTPKEKTLTLESKNAFGAHRASLHAEIQGEPLSMVFNYHYVLEGAESYKDETLFFGFNGDTQPLVMRSHKKDSSLYIVMPMKGGA